MTIQFTAALLAGLALLVALTGAGVFVWLGRLWDFDGLALADRLRIARVVNSYDTWLSLRSVPTRRRRDLREELRTNLWEAGRRVGAREAIAAVGSVRELAREATVAPAGPRWLKGLALALLAAEVTVVVQLLSMTVWLDAAEASKVARISGGVGLFPGMQASYTSESAGGFSVAMSPGPSALVIGVLAFLIASRPWRLARTA